MLGEGLHELQLAHLYEKFVDVCRSDVVLATGVQHGVDGLPAGLAHKLPIEGILVEIVDECCPEDVKVNGIVGFEGVDPEIEGDFVGSVDVDAIVFELVLVNDMLGFPPLLDYLGQELLVHEMLVDSFINLVRSLRLVLLKGRQQLSQL